LAERSTWPASPTAKPICPPSFWNVMSVSLIELGPKVRVNVPAGCRVKISPFAVTNQKRASDWYSMPSLMRAATRSTPLKRSVPRYPAQPQRRALPERAGEIPQHDLQR